MFVVYQTFTGESELFFFQSALENAIMLSTTKYSADNYAACFIQDVNLKVINLGNDQKSFVWAILIQDVDYDYTIIQIDEWSQFHSYLAENMEIIQDVSKIYSADELIPFTEKK